MRKFVLAVFCLCVSQSTNAQVPASNSWTYVQDSIVTGCTSGTTCNVTGTYILPTKAGSVWILKIGTTNNITISSITSSSGTWASCSCHIFDSGSSTNLDAFYNLSGNSGSQTMTVNLSGSSAGLQVQFIELMPPSGATGVFDVAGSVRSNSCTTCTAVGLTLTGTDVVFQTYKGNGTSAWNAWSSPYIVDSQGYGIAFNTTSGTAPTVVMTGAQGASFIALAFKASTGTFTPPTPIVSLVNFTASTQTCSSCTVTIPSTGSGNMLYVEEANINTSTITSVTCAGCGSWVKPTGANSCQIALSSSNELNCAYLLSAPSGVTSLSVTMSASVSHGFGVFEVSSTGGAFTFDVQGSATNGASLNPPGVTLTLGRTVEVIFQSFFGPGGSSSTQLYAVPYINGQGHQILNNQAAVAVLLNNSDGTGPLWIYQNNAASTVTGMAFFVPGPPATGTILSGGSKVIGAAKVM